MGDNETATGEFLPSIPDTPIPLEIARDFSNFDDALQYFAQEGIQLSSGEEVSDGFYAIQESMKAALVGVPFLILDFSEFEGKFGGDEPLTVRVMLRTPIILPGGVETTRIRLSDSSTGIAKQLRTIYKERRAAGHNVPNQGIIVQQGLRESVYTYSESAKRALTPREMEDFKAFPAKDRKEAVTYYLAF